LARQKLNQVMIERKTHEKLKEKAFEEYKKQLDDYEKKEIDELISYSYNKIK
jgi:flagellar FliJ protein